MVYTENCCQIGSISVELCDLTSVSRYNSKQTLTFPYDDEQKLEISFKSKFHTQRPRSMLSWCSHGSINEYVVYSDDVDSILGKVSFR